MKSKEVGFLDCRGTAKILTGIALFVMLSSAAASAQVMPPYGMPKIGPINYPPKKPTPCKPPKDLLECKKNYDIALLECDKQQIKDKDSAPKKRAQCDEMSKHLKKLFDDEYDKQKVAKYGADGREPARGYGCGHWEKEHLNFNPPTSDVLKKACHAVDKCRMEAAELETSISPNWHKCRSEALSSFGDQCNAVACQKVP